jgi:hypothetical protein
MCATCSTHGEHKKMHTELWLEKPHGRTRYRCKDDIKMCLREAECESVNSI